MRWLYRDPHVTTSPCMLVLHNMLRQVHSFVTVLRCRLLKVAPSQRPPFIYHRADPHYGDWASKIVHPWWPCRRLWSMVSSMTYFIWPRFAANLGDASANRHTRSWDELLPSEFLQFIFFCVLRKDVWHICVLLSTEIWTLVDHWGWR